VTAVIFSNFSLNVLCALVCGAWIIFWIIGLL
jgi:hypothetical protein